MNDDLICDKVRSRPVGTNTDDHGTRGTAAKPRYRGRIGKQRRVDLEIELVVVVAVTVVAVTLTVAVAVVATAVVGVAGPVDGVGIVTMTRTGALSAIAATANVEQTPVNARFLGTTSSR